MTMSITNSVDERMALSGRDRGRVNDGKWVVAAIGPRAKTVSLVGLTGFRSRQPSPFSADWPQPSRTFGYDTCSR